MKSCDMHYCDNQTKATSAYCGGCRAAMSRLRCMSDEDHDQFCRNVYRAMYRIAAVLRKRPGVAA